MPLYAHITVSLYQSLYAPAVSYTHLDVYKRQMQLMGINISRSIYSQIEGGTYNIRVSELAAMKEIFNINYESFFEGISVNTQEL